MLAPALALLAGLLAVALFPGDTPNPDGVVYYALAGYWAQGHWAAALNDYWSPLLSMLLAPAAALGLPLHLSARLLGVLVGCAMVWQLQRLMKRLDVTSPVRLVVASATVPFVVLANVSTIGPDALVALLLLGFVTEMITPVRRPWLAGIWAGFAFLAKSYALPFVLTWLGALAIVRSARVGKRAAATDAAVAGGVCMGIVLAWSVAISYRVATVSSSTSADYHRTVTAPGSLGNAYHWAGLIEPEHERAAWAWENPATLPTPDERAAFASSAPRPTDGRLSRTAVNARVAAESTWSLLSLIAPIAASVIAAALLASIRAGALRGRFVSIGETDWRAIEIALAIAIYTGGLLLLVVRMRYLYPPMLLAIALAAVGLSAWRRRGIGLSRVALAIAALSLAASSTLALVQARERRAARDEVHRFVRSIDGGLEGRRVASFPPDLVHVGAVCRRAGCVYLGGPRAGVPAHPLPSQLEAFGVDRLFLVGERTIELPASAALIAESERIGPEPRRRYRVYALPARAAPTTP